jgi:hypothetical protein
MLTQHVLLLHNFTVNKIFPFYHYGKYVYFVWFSKQTTIVSLNNTNNLVWLMKTACVYSVIYIWSACFIIFKGNFSFCPESTANYLIGSSTNQQDQSLSWTRQRILLIRPNMSVWILPLFWFVSHRLYITAVCSIHKNGFTWDAVRFIDWW